MIADTFVFFGAITLIALIYGVASKLKGITITGFILVLLLGLFVMTDGVMLQTGSTKIINDASTVSGNSTIMTGNETTTFNYATPAQIGPLDWATIFGLVLILIGLAGTYSEATEGL
jgi:hypothetical protein